MGLEEYFMEQAPETGPTCFFMQTYFKKRCIKTSVVLL
jgi:hypothetical protein